MTSRRWGWGLAAVGLFASSLDFWRWDHPIAPGPGGLPGWIVAFIALQFLLAGGMWVFVRGDWDRLRSRDDEEDDLP